MESAFLCGMPLQLSLPKALNLVESKNQVWCLFHFLPLLLELLTISYLFFNYWSTWFRLQVNVVFISGVKQMFHVSGLTKNTEIDCRYYFSLCGASSLYLMSCYCSQAHSVWVSLTILRGFLFSLGYRKTLVTWKGVCQPNNYWFVQGMKLIVTVIQNYFWKSYCFMEWLKRLKKIKTLILVKLKMSYINWLYINILIW